MTTRLANLALSHPRRVAVVALLLLVLAGVFGGPVLGALNARNAFADPSSASSRAQALIQQATGAEASPGVVALVGAPPSSPAVASAARILGSVPGVAEVVAPTSGHEAGLVSRDGRESLIEASLRSAPDPNTVAKRIISAFKSRHDVRLGGTDITNEEVSAQANRDLGFAELLAFPILAVLALLIFRGLAALLPLTVGGLSVVVTFLVLRGVNAALPLSGFALNLVIGLGLGLAVDWSLLFVWRLREQLGRGQDPAEALRTTMATAGRTVCFSTITVAAAMSCLLVFPQRFLVSMGLGGVIVALVAGTSTLLVLPSLAVLLAGRIGRVRPRPDRRGAWYRAAQTVMRRPALVAVATTAVLLLVASPVLGVRWSGIDASVLPTSQSARVVSDTLARNFPTDQNVITVAAQAPARARPEIVAYEARLARVPGVTPLAPPTYLGDRVWKVDLSARGDPISTQSQRTVSELRAVTAPIPAEVGGQAAAFADEKTAVSDNWPIALAVLVALTLLILWLMTGSLILPVQALAMNALTALVATGLLVFVFQDGRLTGPLAYTSQGGIELTDFLVLGAIVFALSTDYGVLLLTRIKEAYDSGLPTRDAVARGLERTGRLVSAAAVMLAVAIGAFATSKVVFLKEVGIGVAAAVLIDAFIVRGALVPSLMAWLGERNWYSPPVLRRLHQRIEISDTASPSPSESYPPPSLAAPTATEGTRP